MGVWDSISNVVRRVSGNAAEVELVLSPTAGMPGDRLTVQIEVVNGKAALDVRALVVDVEANEHITLKSAELALDEFSDALNGRNGAQSPSRLAHQPHTANVLRATVRVADAVTLGAGERKSYSGTVRIPERAQPTFHGTNVQHTWRLRARLDVLGTDPSSQWQEFVVGRRV